MSADGALGGSQLFQVTSQPSLFERSVLRIGICHRDEHEHRRCDTPPDRPPIGSRGKHRARHCKPEGCEGRDQTRAEKYGPVDVAAHYQAGCSRDQFRFQ